MKQYKIKFLKSNKNPNWVNVSNIDKKTFNDFISYLYQLNRDIVVLPYIPGGGGPIHVDPSTDRTYLVEGIADSIKNKTPINEILFSYFVNRWKKIKEEKQEKTQKGDLQKREITQKQYNKPFPSVTNKNNKSTFTNDYLKTGVIKL